MPPQFVLETGKSKPSGGWLQRMAANLGFSNTETLRETLESAIAASVAEEDTSLSAQERLMLLNVLAFGETKVSEVMVPRADIVAAEQNQSVAELFALFAEKGHARIPIYRDSLDDPVGMIHIKDAMAWVIARKGDSRMADVNEVRLNASIEASGLVREALFVPPSMPALALMAKMKAKQTHLAIVVDEFGGTDGLATLKDLVDAIVGDIADEHDEDFVFAFDAQDDAFVAKARTPIEDVEQVLGLSLTVPGVTEDVDTLGGLILAMSGSIPTRGQLIAHPSGVTFEIVESGPRRIHLVRIFRPRAVMGPEHPLLLPAPSAQDDDGASGSGNEPMLRDAKAA